MTFIKQSIVFTGLFFLLCCRIGFAQDSTSLRPSTVKAGKGRGFVLYRGELRDKLYKSNPSRTHWISNVICPKSYQAYVLLSPQRNQYTPGKTLCLFRGYAIEADDKPIEINNTYRLYITNLYAKFEMCDEQPITVDYTIYCL